MDNSQAILAQVSAKYGTQDPNTLDLQRWQYYDSVRIPVGGTNTMTFFSNPLGSVDPISGLQKTMEETNLRRAGELDYPYVITEVRTKLHLLPIQRQAAAIQAVTDQVIQGYTTVAQDLRNIAEQGVLSILFGQKKFVEVQQPFQSCPPGFGPSLRSIGAHGAGAFVASSVWYSQSVDPRDKYVMSPPIFVEKSQTIQATMQFIIANTFAISQVAGENVAVNAVLIFDGYTIRPVQ